MKLRASAADRMRPPPGREGGGGSSLHLLVYGVLAPLSLIVFGASAWYFFTGETPIDLFEALSGSPRVAMTMPPSIGPERNEAALIRPPKANDPDVQVSMNPVQPPTPETKAPAPEAKAPAPPVETKAPDAPKPAPKAENQPEPPPAASTAVAPPPPPPAMSEPIIPPGGEPLAPPTFAQLPARNDLKPLAPAPLPELMRASPVGALPIAAGGKESRAVYARPFAGDASLPRIGVVVVGLGLSKEATEAAISKLPPEISLSFSPYASNLDNWIKRARAAGHEVLVDLPLEPPNFPLKDAGPLAVLTRQTPAEAQQQLLSVLGKTTSYVGVAAALHSPVPASEQWAALLRTIRGRGLLFVGDGLVGVAQTDVPAAASVTLVADETPFRVAIDSRLLRLQAAAQRDGSAIAYISPRPVSFERLLAWLGAFPQKGLVLAPVSAVVSPPP